MELTAVLQAVSDLKGQLEVVSDSSYVVNCFRDRWWVNWQKRNWRNAKGEPVANQDLWKPLVDIVTGRQIAFRWVKGHSGDAMNELVDQLAVQAARAQRGAKSPDDFGLPNV